MPGVYDGAEVLVWVNMAESQQASSQVGTTTAAIVVTLNNTGTNIAAGQNQIQFEVKTPTGTANTVAVTYSGGITNIALTPAATGGAAVSAAAVTAINTSPAAKYYITASLPSIASAGTAIMVGPVSPFYIGQTGAGTTVVQAGVDGTVLADDFRPVTRQQGVDYDDTMDTIDAVSKGDRFALALAGRQSGSFELSGLHSYEDTTQERIRRAYQRRELVRFRRVFPSTVYATSAGVASTLVQEASCRVTGFSISHPDSDVATFSAPVSLQENWKNV